MEVDREIVINNVEEQLRIYSLEEIDSCGSSILDASKHADVYDDDDDCEDGINVTLLSTSATKTNGRKVKGSKEK